MKKRSIYLLLYLLAVNHLVAQNISVSASQLNFGNVTAGFPETLAFTLSNPFDFDVQVTSIDLFSTYNKFAFEVDNSSFPIAAGASETINVTFNPKHNIYHNTELIINTNNNRGSVSVDLLGQGIYPETYYNNTLNLKEEELKLELKDIISFNYHSLGYDDARDTIYMRVDNWKYNGQGSSQNKILKVYTGDFATGYANRSDLQSNYNVNAEHTFPQSTFTEDEPMRSDMHHLFATSEESNGIRSNYPFGYAINYVYWEVGGSIAGFDDEQYVVFEPRDEQKGVSARAMLYFLTRYQNYSNFVSEKDNNILKEWNFNFTPTDIEANRNDDIQYYQHNRNPFTDHPEFADRIRLFNTVSSELEDYALFISNNPIDFGEISSTGNFQYSLLLYNQGNRNINLSNFQLSSTSQLSFIDGSEADQILLPGEIKKVIVDLNILDLGQSVVNETLNFSASEPEIVNYAIPIYANYQSVSVGEKGLMEELNLFPNPSEDRITVVCKKARTSDRFSIYNSLGKLVLTDQFLNSQGETNIDISDLAQGVYFLQVSSKILKGVTFVKNN